MGNGVTRHRTCCSARSCLTADPTIYRMLRRGELARRARGPDGRPARAVAAPQNKNGRPFGSAVSALTGSGNPAQKLKDPEFYGSTHSPRPVARFRPLLTCCSLLPCGSCGTFAPPVCPHDSHRAAFKLGLRAYRQPGKPAEHLGILSCLRRISCSPRPAPCYRPLPALHTLSYVALRPPLRAAAEPSDNLRDRRIPASTAMLTGDCGVTWLEPRTQHQPGKLQKLSKNEAESTPLPEIVKSLKHAFILLRINHLQTVHSMVPTSCAIRISWMSGD